MRKLLPIFILLNIISSCERADLPSIKGMLYVRQNGADIPAYIYGNGAEKVFVIWLHGGPGQSALPDRSAMVFKELEKKYAVVYFDQRGQGMAQGNYPKSLHHIDEMSKDVKALAQILKYKYGSGAKLFLMGGSWGGALGTKTLLDPEAQALFHGWIEVDGGHDSPARNQGTIDMINEIGQDQIALGNNAEYWTAAIERVNSYDISDLEDCTDLNSEAHQAEYILQEDGYFQVTDTVFSGYFNYHYIMENPITTSVSNAFSSADLEKQTDIFTEFTLTDSLYRIELPTLLLWGKYDIVVSPAIAQTCYEKISSEHKELVILEHSGHNTAAHQPMEFVDAVVEFIEQHK